MLVENELHATPVLSQKSKFFTTKDTKDFHKEHKALLNNILYLCPLCGLRVLCG